MSNVLGERYFNYAYNHFFTTQQDRAAGRTSTARFVCSRELKIKYSLTVESSFFGYRKTKYSPVLQRLSEQGYREAGA